MTSMTITVTRTAKSPTTRWKGRGMIVDGFPIEDLFGFDFATVQAQELMFFEKDQLNAIGAIKMPNSTYYTSTINSDGCEVLGMYFVIDDVSIVPGLTVDNAYDVCISTKLADAVALGIGEYQKWKLKYWDEKYVRTHVVTTA
jgi:hypothetical protein